MDFHYASLHNVETSPTLPPVAVCCRMMASLAICCDLCYLILQLHSVDICCNLLPNVAICCRMLQDVVKCCNMLPRVTICWQMLQYVAKGCNMLPNIAICCHLLPFVEIVCNMLPYLMASVAICCHLLLSVSQNIWTNFQMPHVNSIDRLYTTKGIALTRIARREIADLKQLI